MNIELALIICKEGGNRDRVALATARCGLNPFCCSDLKQAGSLLVQCDFTVVLCEDELPDGDFHMALRAVRETGSHAPVIVLSQNASWESYLNTLASGAFDCIVCPASIGESARIVRCAIEETAHAVRDAEIAA